MNRYLSWAVLLSTIAEGGRSENCITGWGSTVRRTACQGPRVITTRTHEYVVCLIVHRVCESPPAPVGLSCPRAYEYGARAKSVQSPPTAWDHEYDYLLGQGGQGEAGMQPVGRDA